MKRLALFVVCGAVFGGLLWGASSVMAAGGHGTGLGFTLSFPYSEALHRLHPASSNDWLLYGIALLQMPLYALIVGTFWNRRQRILGLVIPFVAHGVGIGFCLLPQSFYEAFW